jgi:MFS family permease
MRTTIAPTGRLTRTRRDDRSRWVALLVLCVGMLMIVLDATVVNVALPAIQRDLGFSQSSLAWVVNAYLIAFGGLLLLAGRLGDLVSRRRVFLAGLGVFTAASLLCGLAQSQQLLIVARFVQGVGGAMTSPRRAARSGCWPAAC